jgi:hypothetical protein
MKAEWCRSVRLHSKLMSKIGTENVKDFPTCIPLTGTCQPRGDETNDRKGIELQELQEL